MDDLQDWIWLGLEVIGILIIVLGFIWKAVKQPFEYELRNINEKLTVGLKHQGERLGSVEAGAASNEKSIEELRRMDQQHAFEIIALQREQGRHEGILEKIEHLQYNQNKTATEIQVELGKLSTRMDIFTELRDVIREVLDKRERKS